MILMKASCFLFRPARFLELEVRKPGNLKHSGWLLLVHPDFLWNTPLAKTIKQYEYFDYSVHEALFLFRERRNNDHQHDAEH